MMRLLASLLPFVLSAEAATGVILPLYIYPGTNAAAWKPVTSAVAAYPSVQWQIVINPNSGPGSTTYPDSNYIAGIKALNAYSNVKTIGYVDTAYASRAYSAVTADVQKYVGWSSYTGGNIAMHGIFFDDVPSIYDFQNNPNSRTPADTYYKNITSYTYSVFPSQGTTITLNPGNPGGSEFFGYCNTLVEFENSFANYQGQTTINSISSNQGVLSKSAIIIHDTPGSTTQATVNSQVHTIKAAAVQFVYYTSDCCYNAINATLLNFVASAVNSA